MRWSTLLRAGLLAMLVACSKKAQTGPPANTTPAKDALEDPAHPGLERCKGSATAAQLTSNLEIARSFRESCHEMVVCGGLNAALTTTLIKIMINAAAGSKTEPTGFTFDGKGKWAAGTMMDVWFHLGFDTSFGKKDDLVAFNLFDLSTYFTGYVIKATASINTKGEATSKLTMEFTGLGPGIELLGFGAKPTSPIVVDSDKIAEAIGKLQLAAKIHVFDKKGNSEIQYELDMPKTTLASINSGGATEMKLLDVKGSRPDVGQVLKVTAFDIDYRDIGGGYLDGQIGFEITGGSSFPYAAVFTYPRRSAPDVTLSCETGKAPAFDAGVSPDAGSSASDAGASD